jgi:hypothetical protein
MSSPARTRYRFGGFTLSPSRRSLRHEGREVPLIPRYLDLLMLLVERRAVAPHRQEEDDGRDEDAVAALPAATAPGARAETSGKDPFAAALARLLDPATSDEGRRDAAEELHGLGTTEALRRLDRRPGHARAWANLRDSRWDVAGAGEVPLLSAPAGPVRLGAVSLAAIVAGFPTTRVDLGRLGRPLGEKGLGPRTRLAIGPGEGLLFGAGLAAGLTHRPRRRSPSP